MHKKYRAARAAVLALAALLLSDAAFAANDPYADILRVKAWEGDIDIQAVTKAEMGPSAMFKTYHLDGKLILDKRTATAAGAEWTGWFEGDLKSKWWVEAKGARVDIYTPPSPGKIKTEAKLYIDGNGTFQIDLTDYNPNTPLTAVAKTPKETQTIPLGGTGVIPLHPTDRLPLPKSGRVISFQGTVSNARMGPASIVQKGSIELRPKDLLITTDAPECNCKTLKKGAAPTDDLTITAKVEDGNPGGGKFQKFEIQYEGAKPVIVSQTLGKTAMIVLRADETTGPIVIKAVFRTKDGKLHYSDAQRIRFCFLREIELTNKPPNNGTDYAFDGSADLAVEAVAVMWLDGQPAVFDDVDWKIEAIGASVLDKKPGFGVTGVRFEFKGLPADNTDFGPKKITASPVDKICNCEQEKEVRVFFPPKATNHPGDGSGDTPNWYYYWMQTSATSGIDARYTKTLTSSSGAGTVQGQYDYNDDVIYLSDALYQGSCYARTAGFGGGMSVGLDCFGETLLHENQHMIERHAWWGDENPKVGGIVKRPFRDPDGDLVPTEVEEKLALSHGCDPENATSCKGRPDPGLPDVEMNSYTVGWSWARGSANAEDWACDESQWTGGACP